MRSPEILAPFTDLFSQVLSSSDGFTPLLVLVYEGQASVTRLALVGEDAADSCDDAISHHLAQLESLPIGQRVRYHERVDVHADPQHLIDVLAAEDPIGVAVARTLASTHFGRELAAEGQPVVAVDDDRLIRRFTYTDIESIAARLAASSPGPWRVDGSFIKDALGQPIASWQIPGRDDQPWHRADADFIAHAWTDITTFLEAQDRRGDDI